MKEIEHKLNTRFKDEADEILFQDIQFGDKLKQSILWQAKAEQSTKGAETMQTTTNIRQEEAQARPSVSANASNYAENRRPARWSSKWALGTAAAAFLLVAALFASPLLDTGTGPQVGPAPGPGASSGITDTPPPAGSELSQLTTVPVSTPQEARKLFGNDLLLPTQPPAGYTLSRIEATGMGDDVSRIVLFYEAGGKEVTFMADRSEAFIPVDMFTAIDVNGASGLVFAQPEMTELFWQQDGVQYAISGQLTQDEALELAGSVAAP